MFKVFELDARWRPVYHVKDVGDFAVRVETFRLNSTEWISHLFNH